MLKQHINTNAADLSRVDSISAAFSTPSFLIFRTVSVENTALVELHEGKFHQVKRMFAAVENHVEQLLRVQMGGLPIDVKLGKGDYLLLLHKDIERLFKTPDFSEVLRFCACFFCSYWINE